jgi:hypothetical protein
VTEEWVWGRTKSDRDVSPPPPPPSACQAKRARLRDKLSQLRLDGSGDFDGGDRHPGPEAARNPGPTRRSDPGRRAGGGGDGAAEAEARKLADMMRVMAETREKGAAVRGGGGG